MTKHDQILAYIESLPVGDKISVRRIAKTLEVSEGTAYRAIKEAENVGLVSTIERVGTIRIESRNKAHIKNLSFQDIVTIIDGDVLAGKKGLDKILDKFVIGAMTPKSMKRYITPGALMIVGDREDVQKLALEQGAAVLLTGGFDASLDIMTLADELKLPILRTYYDTFTVGTMINRAMSDQIIKKDIALVADILKPISETESIFVKGTLADYHLKVKETGYTRFPVVNKADRLVGMITAKDVENKPDIQAIEKVMTKDPLYAKTHMTVANVWHQMIWDGFEIIPVVEDDLTLTGIISRNDVMKSMQVSQSQTQIAHKLTDHITNQIVEKKRAVSEDPFFTFLVTPQMVNYLGTLSFGVLNQIISSVVRKTIFVEYGLHSVIEQMSLYYLKLIPIDSEIEIETNILEFGRRSSKLEVNILKENVICAKAIVVCQLIDPV